MTKDEMKKEFNIYIDKYQESECVNLVHMCSNYIIENTSARVQSFIVHGLNHSLMLKTSFENNENNHNNKDEDE
jgi:hypothetical protein